MSRSSLVRTIIERRLEGEKARRRRLRKRLMDCVMKEDYSKFKERAGHRGECRHWTYEAAYEGGRDPSRRISSSACLFWLNFHVSTASRAHFLGDSKLVIFNHYYCINN